MCQHPHDVAAATATADTFASYVEKQQLAIILPVAPAQIWVAMLKILKHCAFSAYLFCATEKSL